MKRLILSAVLLTTLASEPAVAEVLTLDCRVQSAKPGYRGRGIRRLRIDLSARTVEVSDNTGKGFRVRGTRPLVSADTNRIVLENSGGKTSVVDRHSGQYIFRNTAERLVIQGRCAKSSGAATAF